MKSFKADDGSEDDKPDFKGTKRGNKTHSSRTDKDARLMRKEGPGVDALPYGPHHRRQRDRNHPRMRCVTSSYRHG